MLRALKALFWLVFASFAVSALGFVLMAVDGYDYWSPLFPQPGSLGETGFNIATVAQVAGLALMTTTWIVLSLFVVKTRDLIPTTWKHSKSAIWLWWLVPVAWFWMPRDVFMEIAVASRPADRTQARRSVNRWWIAFVSFLVINYLAWIEAGPTYLAIVAVVVLIAAFFAAYHASRLFTAISQPEVTFDSVPDFGEKPIPATVAEPTVPGWYNDPTGQAPHQAYWDGGRFTGAIRPDPRRFPSRALTAPEETDALRIWLIVGGIVVTLAMIAYLITSAFIPLEDPEFTIARVLCSV